MRGRKEIDFPYKVENNIYFLYPLPVHLFRRMDYDFFDKFIDDCGGEFLYPHILTDNCRKAVKVALILFVGIDFLGYTKYCKGYSDYKGLTREIEKSGNYKKTKEKARGQIETREYYQTEDIQWMIQKKRLERAEKHSDGKKKHRKERAKENGMPLFYQQPKRGHGNHKPGSKRALEHREHALASGCNISRRRKRNTG